MPDENVPLAGEPELPEIREQLSFACGCVLYRKPDGIEIHPCPEHETIKNLPGRQYRRMIKWPVTEAMLGRAARQGRPVIFGE